MHNSGCAIRKGFQIIMHLGHLVIVENAGLHNSRTLLHNSAMKRIATILGLRPHDLRRVLFALSMILAILMAGIIGYSVLAGLNLVDAFYMTVITISTVGFTELGEFDSTVRLFSALLIVFTLVWGAWALQSVLGIFLNERFRMGVSQISAVRRAQRMQDHTVICGYGRIGQATADEFERNDEPYVIVEHDLTLVEELREQGIHVVHGDATEDHILIAAGIKNAKRLVAALNNDNDNIVTVLSARQLNKDMIIASRVVVPEAERKLRRAGADRVISPYSVGGRRIALELMRPHVGEFLHAVIFDEGKGAEVDEVLVRANSDLADKTLSEIRIRQRFGVNVLALHHPQADDYHRQAGFELDFGPDTVLHVGDVLIVVGNATQLSKLHQAVGE